ncbi:MAG TPA: aminotransferase class I/II-fold pyridoxal phosphate-dependent enzyme [Solirubrobacteraceae bacterium]|nr:aminotransferase class I/II-fold pyridoxal phosphate-dependent enzyme [Solirubrobacteraceae bacterium]
MSATSLASHQIQHQTVSEKLWHLVAIDLSVPDLEALHRRAGEKWAAHDPDVLSLTIAEMDFPLAPAVAEALHHAIDRADLGYPGPAWPSLRRSFCGFAERRLNWEVDQEQIVLVPDVMIGLVELELEAIAERCAEREVWVLADEIHAPVMLPGATHLPWLEVSDAARRWGVSLTSASKAFNLAALKAALMVTADPAARDLVARVRGFDDHAGLLGVIAAQAAFEEGDEWLDAVIDQLAANREQLGRDLAQRVPEIKWTPPQATYLAWFDCTGLGLGDDPAEAFLTKGRVALSPGLHYGATGAGHARLNFATSPVHLSEAVSRIAHTRDNS